ncbi:MAG: dolichol kinase [Ignavibacteria bacterium]|nr:dolichol kinase [Ignavibacteria bacterium]
MDFKAEVIRKGIHFCSLSIPTIYYYISRELALQILVPVTLAFLIADVARYYIPAVSRWFYTWFGWLLRRHEQDGNNKKLNGATNILLSAVLCVLVFPKIITVNAFAILIISDSTAALVGRRFGKRRLFKKSLEGALAFFVSALLVVLVAPKLEGLSLEYVIGAAAAFVGALVETGFNKVDDNIAIPVSIGATMWLLYTLLLPSLDLHGII